MKMTKIVSCLLVGCILFSSFAGKYVTAKAESVSDYEEIIEQYYEYVNLGRGEEVASLYSEDLAEYTDDFFADTDNKTEKAGIFNVNQTDVVTKTVMSSYETFSYEGVDYTDVKKVFVKCDMQVNQSDKYYMEGTNYFVFYIGKNNGNNVIFNIEIPSYSTICEYEDNMLVANSYQADRNYYLYGIANDAVTRSDAAPVYVDVVANPTNVRVYMAETGTVSKIGFATYLRRTAAVELNSGLVSQNGYIAATMAIKMYAIYRVLTVASGINYDIHNGIDQGYSVTATPSSTIRDAVNTVLDYFLLDYYGAVFLTYHKDTASESTYCRQYGGVLPYAEAASLGQSQSWQNVLRYYYTRMSGYSYTNSQMNYGSLIITTAHTHDFSDPSGCAGCGAVPY